MALSELELHELHQALPASWEITDDQLEAAYELQGTWQLVAAGFVRARLMALLSGPASFTIPGEYGENNGATITALTKMLALFDPTSDASGESSLPVIQGRLRRPDRSRAGAVCRLPRYG